jgi:hypothetical protein
MISGYNNNVMINGEVFHIQTEDGGTNNPVISTVVFKAGQVVLSKKTNYADIIKFEKLGSALKEIMKVQHIATLKALRDKFNSDKTDNSSGMTGNVVEDVKNNEPLIDKAIDDIIQRYLRADKVDTKGEK